MIAVTLKTFLNAFDLYVENFYYLNEKNGFIVFTIYNE